MTTDTSALISPDVDWRRNEAALDRAFPQNGDVTLVVIDGVTSELAEAGAATLTARLAADKTHFHSVTRPDGGDFFARNGLLFAAPDEVRASTARLIDAQPLLGPLASDPSLRGVMNALGTIVGGVADGHANAVSVAKPIKALTDALDPISRSKPAYFSWQALFADGNGTLAPPTRRLILVRPRLDYDALMPGEASSDAIRATISSLSLDADHGVNIRLTGSVPLADEEFASLADKAWLVGGAIVIAMLLTLWLATRSIRTVVAILLTTLIGLIVTTALGLAIIGRFNLISVAFIPLFVGLGVDFGIQISVRFGAEQHDGLSARSALIAAAQALGPSLMLAACAVCLGFFAFLPTSYIGISELGIIAGLGMIVALVLNVTLLPACLLRFKPGVPKREVGYRALAPVDHFLIARRRWILWAFGLSMLGSIALLPSVRFDFNPLHLRDARGEAMATLTDLTHDPDRTSNTIDILAANAIDGERIAKHMARLPQVRQTVTLDSFVPSDQTDKLATIADARGLLDLTLNPFVIAPTPNDADLIASLRAAAAALRHTPALPNATRLASSLDRLAAGSPGLRAHAQAMLIQPLDTMLDQIRLLLQAEPVTRATLPPELVRDWIAPDGRTRVQLFPAGDPNDNMTLERFTAEVRRAAPSASGPPISTQAAARTITHAFIQAGMLALITVSLLLFAVLRDVREVAFTLAPVVLSGFLTLGTCVLIGQPINFANIIAFPLLFGVGTAFHIYFVMAWRGGATDLLQSPLTRAILFSALATGSAFGSLWLSNHPGTASMGKILMISLVWTLICALVFEPALLGKPDRQSSRNR